MALFGNSGVSPAELFGLSGQVSLDMSAAYWVVFTPAPSTTPSEAAEEEPLPQVNVLEKTSTVLPDDSAAEFGNFADMFNALPGEHEEEEAAEDKLFKCTATLRRSKYAHMSEYAWQKLKENFESRFEAFSI